MTSGRIISGIDHTWDGSATSDTEIGVVEIDFLPDAVRIEVVAPFHGDPPPPGPPGPTESLWNYEVVEVFLVGSDRYLEVELSPHGHYLALELSAPRVIERTLIPIDFEVNRLTADAWEGTAIASNALLPEGLATYNTYRMHGTGSDRRHLARFPVPGEKPDFHRLECFGKIEFE